MLVDAFKYKYWADIRTIEAVEEVHKELQQTNYEFMLQQLNHIISLLEQSLGLVQRKSLVLLTKVLSV